MNGDNPFAERLKTLAKRLRRRRLEAAVVESEANVRALTGIDCDNAKLLVDAAGETEFYTDFRYQPMVKRLAPYLRLRDLRDFSCAEYKRLGFESGIPARRYFDYCRKFPRVRFADVASELERLRAVKTPEEIAAIRAAERLTCEIWQEARGTFAAGMTEREMALVIKKLMLERGDGEAFATIVCVGKNAAECHHVPDDTVWNGREAVLVDMGVKLNGYCSDLTRNLLPRHPSRAYREAYRLVREANFACREAARPGMTGRKLDAMARRIIARGGFKRAFGHSLGHGVGLEIHEPPYASKSSDWRLEPGMLLTIEPGIYLEGNLGVRIEDLVLITEDGCETLSDTTDMV